MLQSDSCGVSGVLQVLFIKDEDDDGNKLSVKLVKLLIFMGNHMEFHTWWFHFQAFLTVWKFTEVIEQTSEADLPAMRAPTMAWPQGFTSSVVNQLFEQYEPHDTVSMIDMNRLKQKIGLPTLDSNPQIMFEQIASLENQFKTTMMSSEKIAIAIEKLPSEYQGVITSKMSKEGCSITPKHNEDVAF